MTIFKLILYILNKNHIETDYLQVKVRFLFYIVCMLNHSSIFGSRMGGAIGHLLC